MALLLRRREYIAESGLYIDRREYIAESGVYIDCREYIAESGVYILAIDGWVSSTAKKFTTAARRNRKNIFPQSSLGKPLPTL